MRPCEVTGEQNAAWIPARTMLFERLNSDDFISRISSGRLSLPHLIQDGAAEDQILRIEHRRGKLIEPGARLQRHLMKAALFLIPRPKRGALHAFDPEEQLDGFLHHLRWRMRPGQLQADLIQQLQRLEARRFRTLY